MACCLREGNGSDIFKIVQWRDVLKRGNMSDIFNISSMSCSFREEELEVLFLINFNGVPFYRKRNEIDIFNIVPIACRFLESEILIFLI